MAPAKVIVDPQDNTIKIDSPKAKIVGKFGTSLLYRYEESFNFHPRAYEVLSKVRQLKYRENDVILTMFPKSGSTWLSECVYMIVTQYQYEEASRDSIELRFPQIDSPSHDVFDLILRQYEDPEKQRMVKASIPPRMLIDASVSDELSAKMVRPKVISIFRNPRDVLVSFYHHCKTVKHYDIEYNFNQFFETFVEGKVPCGPIQLMYNEMFQYHLDNPKTSMILYYEDMKFDLRGQIKKICAFLNKQEPPNEREWSMLMEHLSVEKMRQNRTINRHDWAQLGLKKENGFEFVRKGVVNDWKNFFTDQQSMRFEEVIVDKLLPELRSRYNLKQLKMQSL